MLQYSNIYVIVLKNSVSMLIQYLFALQGLRIIFTDASRLIFRLSASSHVRATLRIYAESYEKDPSKHEREPQVNRDKLLLHFQEKDILYIRGSQPLWLGSPAWGGGRAVCMHMQLDYKWSCVCMSKCCGLLLT